MKPQNLVVVKLLNPANSLFINKVLNAFIITTKKVDRRIYFFYEKSQSQGIINSEYAINPSVVVPEVTSIDNTSIDNDIKDEITFGIIFTNS